MENKMNFAKIKREFFLETCLYIAMILITILVLVIVYELWNRDLSVPLSDMGDTIGAYATAKNILTNSSLTDYANLGAPYTMDNSASVQDYFVPAFIMWIISRFTVSAAVTMNFYYLLTYVLTSISALFVFRRIGLKRAISFFAALVFSFAPYHFFRAISHLWLTSYYVLPLGFLGIYYIFNGSLFDFEKFKNERNLKKRVIFFLRSNLIVSAIGVLVTGLTSIYYTVFLCMCYLFVAFYATIEYKKVSVFAEGIGMAVIPIIPVAINQIKTAPIASEVFEVNIYAARGLSELRVYSLKLLPLILPIPCHRSAILNALTQNYYDQITIYDETYMEALGTVTAIAFIVSMISGLMVGVIQNKQAARISKLNLFLVILGLTDGLNMFVGMFVSASIRCYNRLSIFIAFFSLLVVCIYLNDIKFKHKRAALLLGVLAMCFAIWDQTPNTLKYALDLDLNTFEPLGSYEENEEKYHAQYELIEEMEGELSENAMVLMLPVGNETDPSSLYKTKVFVCSGDLRFNYQWLGDNFFNEYIKNLPPEKQLEVAAICGFEAVILDTEYYSKKEFETISEVLEERLGAGHTNKGTTWQWYDMREYANDICGQYLEEDLVELRDRYIRTQDTFFVRYLANDENICYTGKVQKRQNCVILGNNTIQYGPYLTLEAGKYHITICGENLIKAKVDCTKESGKENIVIEDIRQGDHTVEYDIYLKEHTEGIEFLMSGSEVMLEYIEIIYENCNIAKYDADSPELYYMGQVEKNGEGMLLKSNAVQYGPYITLDSGEYHITIYGKGLEMAEARVTKDGGREEIEISNRTGNDILLEYDFFLEEQSKDVEFIITGSDVLLKSIEIAIGRE